MGNKVSYLIQLQDKFSRQGDKIRKTAKRMVGGFNKLDRKLKKTGVKLARLGKKAKESGAKLAKFGKTLQKNVTLPLAIFGTVALVQSAKLETLATSFETMTGSAEKGQKLLQQLTQFTATTPFQLAGVAKATKTLLAFRVPLDKMLPTLRMLGDIAAGTDAPLSDIAQIFGKARAKGKLMTEEILQLAERGIPIIDVLADKFKVSKATIFDLASKSKISFNVMQGALQDMTAAGGIFFSQTQRQSATLGGLFSTLKDNLLLISAVFGDIIVEVFGLKGGISDLNEFFGELRTKIKAFAEANPVLTKLIAVFVLLIAILGPILFVVGKLVVVFGFMSVAAGVLGISISGMLLPVLAVVAAIGLLIAAGVLIIRNWEGIKGGAKLLWEDISQFFSDMAGAAIELGETVLNFVLAPFKKAFELGEKIGAAIGSFFTGGDIEIKSSQNLTQRSQTDVNVNLRAPEGVVESVKTRTSGKSAGLNMGVNVAAAV